MPYPSKLLKIPALSLLLLLWGCSSAQIDEYVGRTPILKLEQFFNGDLFAEGLIKDHRDKVTRQFTAKIQASWDRGIGTLVEDFTFDDGELQRRIWTLTPDGKGGFVGTAGDVVGDGKITLAGNTMFLKYVLRIPYRDGTLDLTVDDRMYLVSPETLINQSRLEKFGVPVGEILLVIHKNETV